MNNFKFIASNFRTDGDFYSFTPYGSGHIHTTFLLTTQSGRNFNKYILQRFNARVFREPEKVLANTKMITAYLGERTKTGKRGMSYLSMVPAFDNNYWYRDEHDQYYRCFQFIDNSITLDKVDTPQQAMEGAKAFGNFLVALSGFEPCDLHITIPDFHNIQKRLNDLQDAANSDDLSRRRHAGDEISKVGEMRGIASEYLAVHQILPVRVTHNDTKINNVLFDADTGKGLCVIDLDTVMPGTILSDFGDMVRTFTSLSAEDERDLSKVLFRPEIFNALAEGFLEETEGILSQAEKNNLILGGKLIIYMQAIRFLTDFLAGDVYYKTDYPDHNLVRARNQLKLLDSFLEHEKEATDILESLFMEL
ncbi:MAG: hypothetical protein AMS27_10325 [Bacteroides sp. SM23_62_1]|nr:MAG: hypothetical protein AMS27_10325 [Bacteroides sp. SM23_62_1]